MVPNFSSLHFPLFRLETPIVYPEVSRKEGFPQTKTITRVFALREENVQAKKALRKA